jgi:hypothetical protein
MEAMSNWSTFEKVMVILFAFVGAWTVGGWLGKPFGRWLMLQIDLKLIRCPRCNERRRHRE